jgi:hypothetical protein
MEAIEFTTELSGVATFQIPRAVAACRYVDLRFNYSEKLRGELRGGRGSGPEPLDIGD